AALTPVLMGDEVARFRYEVRMPFATPFAAREAVALHDGSLGGVGMIPILVVAGLPAPVWDDHHLDASDADRAIQPTQIVEEPDFVGDRLDAWKNLAAVGQEIVVGIDEKQGGSLAWISGLGHCLLLKIDVLD